MVYVYEKSNNLKKLNEEYTKIVEEKPDDLELLKKLADNSYKLRNENYLEHSIKYYNQKKDYEIIRRIIEAYKEKKDYINTLKWLEIAYTDFDKIEELNEIIAISSTAKNEELLKTYLKKLYLRNSDTKILFTLYGLNDKEYSLERIYNLMQNNQLANEEYNKGLILSIYEKDLDIAYEFYSKKNLDFLEPIKYEKEYSYMLENIHDTEELIKLNQYLYTKTKNESYYKKYTDKMIYEGDIERYLEVTKKRYKKEKRVSDLNEIIKYDYLNEDIESYLSFLSEKVILEKDVKTAESIIAYYIDLGDEDSLKTFLNKLFIITKGYDDFKDLALRTYAYLEMYETAEKLLLQFSPKEVTPNVVYSVFNRKINENSMPYFMEILKDSNDKVTKGKLFRYRYKTLRLFTQETFDYFGKPSTYKKLYSYVETFEEEDKNKILLKFTNESRDPMFISEIAQYFLFKAKKDKAITFFKKSLEIYPKNKLSLKTLASIYLYDNKREEAYKMLTELKMIDNSDVEIDYYLAEYFYQKNNKVEYKKYYTKVINNLKIKSLRDEYIVLRAKSKISTPLEFEKEFEKLISDSSNDIDLITDIWYLFYEDKKYDYLLGQFKKFEELLTKNYKLKEIEVITYIALNRDDIAKDKINSLVKNNKEPLNLAILYERLAYIEYKKFNKFEALKNYEKSLSFNYSKDIEEFTNSLKKEYKTKIEVEAGVRSDIKEFHLGFRKLVEKIKVNLNYDSYEDYSSAKIKLTDLDEKYLFGMGKDYLEFRFNHLFGLNLSLSYEKNIDTSSKLILDNKLKYDLLSLNYSRALSEKLSYNLKVDYYKYNDFNRKRFENSIYIPFNQTYFTSFSFINENVNKQNIFGYESENRYILALGENNRINDNIQYFYSFGGENDEKDTTYFINFDLYYNKQDYDISLRNSFSKDPLNSDYNFNSMLNFSYYF